MLGPSEETGTYWEQRGQVPPAQPGIRASIGALLSLGEGAGGHADFSPHSLNGHSPRGVINAVPNEAWGVQDPWLTPGTPGGIPGLTASTGSALKITMQLDSELWLPSSCTPLKTSMKTSWHNFSHTLIPT